MTAEAAGKKMDPDALKRVRKNENAYRKQQKNTLSYLKQHSCNTCQDVSKH